MPRQLRLEYEGAIYHLMNRGDRREEIFRDSIDRSSFLETLGAVCAKTAWQVHAYCLMGNHFNLVVETPRANLVSGMHASAGCALQNDRVARASRAGCGVAPQWNLVLR